MKTMTVEAQFTLKCLDQRLTDAIGLDKKKILIGSGESCDVRLADKSVSSYHAFLYLKGEGIMVKDLYSESGVYVNGRRVEEAFVNPGDVLTIGTMSFEVQGLEDHVPVFNPDEDIAPAFVHSTSVELPPRPGLVFIDGEYCDIEFDESTYKPLSTLPDLQFKADYVDLDVGDTALDIVHSTKEKKLEIVSYMNGLMMDITYVNLKDGDYYLNSQKKSKFDVLFHTMVKTKIFSISKGELRFNVVEAITPSVAWDKINLNEPVFLTNGAEQISLRFVDQSVKLAGLPMFYRERAFYKEAGKIFSAVIVPMLLLILVSVPVKEELKEEVAVVYKIVPPKVAEKPTESQEKSEVKAEELTSKTENTGHKDTPQPSEKVEFAQASAKKKVVAKATAPAPAPAAPTPVAPPVKAYEFKTSVAVNSLVGDAPKMNTQGSSAKSAVKDAQFNAGSADSGELVAGADVGVSKLPLFSRTNFRV